MKQTLSLRRVLHALCALAGAAGYATAATLIWEAGDGTWADGAGGWGGSAAGQEFVAGDRVVFRSEAEVAVKGEVRPADVLVSLETGTLRITGADGGKIAGATGLTKEGAGTLELFCANAYEGDTVLRGGRLSVRHEQALGSSTAQLLGGELSLGGLGVCNDVRVMGVATLTGGSSFSGKLTLDGGSLSGDILHLAQEAELISGSIFNDLTGAQGAVKTGSGTVTLHGALSYSGGTVVQEGTLALEGASLRNNITVNQGAELRVQDSKLYGRIMLNAGAAMQVEGAVIYGYVLLYSGSSLTSEGGITLGSGSTLSMSGGRMAGDVELAGGVLEVVGDRQVDGSLSLAGGVVRLNGALQVQGSLSSVGRTEVLLSVSRLYRDKRLEIFSAADASGVHAEHIELPQLTNVRSKVEVSRTSVSVLFDGAQLAWQPDVTGAWGVLRDDAWETAAADARYHDLDDVAFVSAGAVNIAGEVNPGSITVQGAGDTTFTGSGHIIGESQLTKSGAGTLEIATDNADYSGEIAVVEGVLKAGAENALGRGAVVVSSGATLENAGGYGIRNVVSFNGASVLKDATGGVSTVVFNDGAKVGGAYTLATGNLLTVGAGAAFVGDFVFAGGTLKLAESGSLLDLSAGAVSFRAREEGKTLIDVSAWSDVVYGQAYALITMEIAEEAAGLFTIVGQKNYTFDYDGSTLWVTFSRPAASEDIAAALTRNQRAAYNALGNIQKAAPTNAALNAAAAEVLNAATAAEAAALLDKLDGAELSTMMQSQIEGNLAHLRRLRANMGSGCSAGGRNAVYLAGYDELSRVRGDASGPGMHRSEWGGMVGWERCAREKLLLGVALNAGWARVNPSSSAPRYHEEAKRLDVYAEKGFGKGWQSVTSVGAGVHDFRLRRTLPSGAVSKTGDVNGWSLNFSEEISYTKSWRAHYALQPFFAIESSVNHIGAFTESGAGSLSLGGRARNAWATDVTLGARFTRFFNAAGGRGSLTMQAGLVASVGDTTSDLNLHFVGAPGVSYTVSTANRNRWGYNVGANVSVPVTKQTSITAGVNAVLRGDSKEANASVGLRRAF